MGTSVSACKFVVPFFLFALAIAGVASAQQLPLAPFHESGQSVTGAFEGWYPNQDGSFTLLMGYFNRNERQVLDIPAGSNNSIEPGGPDQGQPTHFLPGRKWGVFSITVPKDFGDKKLVWTIAVNGETSVVPLNLNNLWRLEPLVDATGNTPPYVGFSNEGPFVNGPAGQSRSISTKVGVPTPLTVWLADDNKDPFPGRKARPNEPVVRVHWIVLRGASPVKFDNPEPAAENAKLDSPPPDTAYYGKAATTATFSAPGEYLLNVQVDDATGGGPAGRYCCWSNAKVAVTVTP